MHSKADQQVAKRVMYNPLGGTLLPEPRIGSIFDKRYLILKELGAGGMGLVFHAKQVDANREVALKFLRIAVSDEDSRTRFFREFKILSELNHPHIMTVYGLGIDSDSNPYAVCEYLEGISLRSHLADGPLNWQDAARISMEIADALDCAHKIGVVHRDLKPENIMLVDKPHPIYAKVIDFGLSRIVQEDVQKLTGTGQLIGSPLYMSPEQSRQKADHRSDIYSLGCILFEMLSGQHLFPADEAISAMYLHSNESATKRFTNITQLVPRELVDLLSEMLEKSPENRIQKAEEIRNRIKHIIEKPGDLYQHSNQTRNLASKLLLTATGLILSAGLLCFGVTKLPQSSRETPVQMEPMPKSFTHEINTIDKELSTFQKDELEGNIVAIPKEEATRKLEAWLAKLKKLENRARNNKEKYRVYSIESVCYAENRDYPNVIKYNLLSLEQIPKSKNERYNEVPGIFFGCAKSYNLMGNIPEAKRFSLKAIEAAKDLDSWIAQGNEAKEMISNSLRNPGWSAVQFGIFPAEIYRNEGNYKEAIRFAQPIYLEERKSFPLLGPGNTSIGGTIIYAQCLAHMGKKEHAVKVMEDIISKLNKPGDIPAKNRPNHQRATAADILIIYANACRWFDEYEPKLAPKYRQQAAQYAKFYNLEDFWANLK